jgi:LDH2 family malate/lactate/ureidoglycolate dehydrogenase
VFDMGTGVISVGKLNQARRAERPIPPGSALDERGEATTDPRAARIPLPLGGPKGSGLALMIECVTSLLAGQAILAEALEGTTAGRRHTNNGLAIAIDIARFGDPGTFRHEVDRLVAALKRLPRALEAEEILAPGERGQRTFEERSRTGIPLAPATVEELARLAERLGVAMFPV